MSEEEKLPTYATFKGRPISNMSRDELIDALLFAIKYIEQIQQEYRDELYRSISSELNHQS
jgi:hypothetical protein